MQNDLNLEDLAQFTGSENWHRHGLIRKVLFTDRAKYVADKAGAYWLLDMIALAQRFEPGVTKEAFQVWTLTVHAERKAKPKTAPLFRLARTAMATRSIRTQSNIPTFRSPESFSGSPTTRFSCRVNTENVRAASRRPFSWTASGMIQNLGYNLAISEVLYHIIVMPVRSHSLQDEAISLLKKKGMARLSELAKAGVTAATMSRMVKKGLAYRLGRGLYQLSDAQLDVNHSIAEAAKRVPKGIICLTSALAFHGLTDTIPSHVWVAIGSKDWQPHVDYPPLQIVRFGQKVLSSGIEEHLIENVRTRIYNPAKTIVDLFRYRQSAGKRYKNSPGLTIAVEGLKEALRTRKATPAEIAHYANEAGAWKSVQPYLEALTANA